MNKVELVKAISEKAEISNVEASKALASVLEVIEEALKAGDSVVIPGFGAFKVSERAARKARNPQTGEEIDIPATKVPSFKAGKSLKEIVK